MKLGGIFSSTLLILCFLDSLAGLRLECPELAPSTSTLEILDISDVKTLIENDTKPCTDACSMYACGPSVTSLTIGAGCPSDFLQACKNYKDVTDEINMDSLPMDFKYRSGDAILLYFAGCNNVTEDPNSSNCLRQMISDDLSDLLPETKLIISSTTDATEALNSTDSSNATTIADVPKDSDDANGAMNVAGSFGIAWILAALTIL